MIQIPSLMPFLAKNRLANVVSTIFNPFVLLPILEALIFRSLDIPLFGARFGLVILFQFILPLAFIVGFVKEGKISDYEITKREERGIYFMLLTIFFGFSIFFVKDVPILYSLSWELTILMFLTYLITFRWKVSGHMALDTLLFFYFAKINLFLAVLFLFLPAVAWSRIFLKKHTLHQVIGGAVLGLLVYLVGVF